MGYFIIFKGLKPEGLKPYEVNEEVITQSDASQERLGCVLLQKG